MKGKKKTWHKKRHAFYFQLQRFLVGIYVRFAYRYRGKKFDDGGRQYLYVSNHQTPLDQHLLYLSLRRLPYTLASEDLFTMGLVPKIIKHAHAPIPIKKSENDFTAVKTCVRIVKEGCSIALSPEGNRTFTGETVHIKPSVAKLIKLLRLPVAVFIVRGGYGVIPRYADKPRRGRVTGSVERVIEYEEYKNLSDEELYNLIKDALHVDESETSRTTSPRRAEFMERAVYVCPSCGAVGTIHSEGNRIGCSHCGISAEVGEDMHFGPSFPVRTVKEWTDRQNEWVNALEVDGSGKAIFAERVRLRVLLRKEGKKQVLAEDAEARIFADRLEVGDYTFAYPEVTAMTVCGRKRLDFYLGGKTYQLTAGNTFCALKYVNIYYNYKNKKENGDGFLGI